MTAPRTCTCCGETKPTKEFNRNNKIKEYIATCRSCGCWLTLFREVFGKTRDSEANREKTRERMRAHQAALSEKRRLARIAERSKPAIDLTNAWYGGMK